MKKALLIQIVFLCVFQGYPQTAPNEDVFSVDLGAIHLLPEQERKISAVFEVMDAVEKTGRGYRQNQQAGRYFVKKNIKIPCMVQSKLLSLRRNN